MLYTTEKPIRKTMLPRLKMLLSIVTALLCRGTLLQIENFGKIFIVNIINTILAYHEGKKIKVTKYKKKSKYLYPSSPLS